MRWSGRRGEGGGATGRLVGGTGRRGDGARAGGRGQAPLSNLPRRLWIGFTRAGRLIDMPEQRGFVAPYQGSKTREVLLSMEQFERLCREGRDVV